MERSRASVSSWAAPVSCSPPVTTRQSGAGNGRRRLRPQRLRNPRRRPVEHRLRRLGRHVARGEPGPARRQDDVHLARVRPARQLPSDPIGLIGHHAPHHHLVTALPRPRDNRVPRGVGPLPHGAQIGHRQYPDTHSLTAYPPIRLVLCGTNGSCTTSAPARLPRTSISNAVPGLACAAGRYVVPIAAFTVGVTVPLRTTPIPAPSRNTG